MSLENKNEITYIPEAEARKERKGFVKKALAVGAIGGSIGGALLGIGGTKAVEAMSHENAPALSDETITVQKGGSEWAIAEELAPNADPRDTIRELEAANKGLSSKVTPGEVIHIPVDLTNKSSK